MRRGREYVNQPIRSLVRDLCRLSLSSPHKRDTSVLIEGLNPSLVDGAGGTSLEFLRIMCNFIELPDDIVWISRSERTAMHGDHSKSTQTTEGYLLKRYARRTPHPQTP